MPDETPPAAWAHLPFFVDDWPELRATLADETRPILPPAGQRFAALAATVPDNVKVVILGQDPYPTPGHANGLAFSVTAETQPLPRSLANIFKELRGDLGSAPKTGDLGFWAEQGVLLLNTALSVPAHDAGGHAKLGWSGLTRDVLIALDGNPRAFVLWGAHARGFRKHLAQDHHLILESAHPSPLSAARGFFGSRPFSKVNDWLKARGEPEINWTTP